MIQKFPLIITLLVFCINSIVSALAPVGSRERDTRSSANVLSQFQDEPPMSYRPRVFWHWVNGNVNKDAIDRDIEALYQSGYGGVMQSDVNAGMPKGPVEYGSDEWLDLIVYAIGRLQAKGMDFSMHNSAGYSGVGSKSLPTNMTMKELVWTETSIPSTNTTATLLHPPSQKMGVYEDIYALAYPSAFGEGIPWRDAVENVSLSGVSVKTNITSTIDLIQPLRLLTSSDYLQFGLSGFWTAQSVSVYRTPELPQNTFDGARDYPPTWTLLTSNDSITWQTVVTFTGPALRAMDAPAIGTFSAVTAKYYKLKTSGPSWITGVELTGGARLADWATKSHGAPGSVVANQAVVKVAPASSIINPDTIIDVSKFLDSEGVLHWSPKNGTYTVVRLGYTVTGQYMPATPDGYDSLSVDLFSTDAIDKQMGLFTNRIIEATKRFIPKTFFGMEIDSYELGMQNWGGNIASDFETYRGYSILPWILAATGRIIQSSEATEKFLFDFRLTHAHLTATKSYGYFRDKLEERGLALLVEPYGDGPFDGMEVASQATHAYGEFWSHNTYGSDGYSEIGTSSGDLHTGREHNMNFQEAFTGQPTSSAHTEHPFQLKAQGDRQMSLGTNRFYFHSYCLQPVEAALPGMMFGGFGAHFDRHATWSSESKAWLTEMGRASLILQSATRLPDTLSFWGEEMNNGGPISYNAPYSVPLSYQQDVFSRSNLFKLSPINGKAVWPSGTGVSLLIFPAMPVASSEVLKYLLYLVTEGVPILLQSTIPSRAVGLNDTDSEVVTLANKLWSMAGNGKVFVNQTAATVLDIIGLAPDMTYTSISNDAAIYFSHSMLDGEDIYFLTNQQRKPVDVVVSLRVVGIPQILDPVTGESKQPASWSIDGGRTDIGLSFGAHESIFIQLSKSHSSNKQMKSISKDGDILYTANAYPAFTKAPWANVSGTFTLSTWAKPEIAEFGSTGFVFYPPISSAYGTGHSAVGIYFALNGLEVVEASTSTPVILTKLAGPWIGDFNHISLVYTNNQPVLYVNGNLVWNGTKSAYIVHPGLDTQDQVLVMMHRFSGDIRGTTVMSRALSQSEVKSLYETGVPEPPLPKPATLTSDSRLLVRQNGNYTITEASNHTKSIIVSSVETFVLKNQWTVTFPANRMPNGASSLSIQLANLTSLHLHPNFDVAHFSGTATYSTTFEISKNFELLLLTLGRVENIASVKVNNKDLGISWILPFETDITHAVHHGTNTLVIEVTNLWVNRLVGDEYLPVEDVFNTTTQNYAVTAWPRWWLDDLPVKTGARVTFGAWHHYNITAPLLASGLIGPVRITSAVLCRL